MLPLIVLFALSTAALSLLTASVVLLMLLFAIQGLFASVQMPAGYSKMITARFDEQRGLALGIALSGTGLGIILVPQYARILMQHYGWRAGYLGIGLAIFILAFIPVAIFFSEPEEMKKDREMMKAGGGVDNPLLPGITLSEAVRTGKYWVLTIAIFLLMMVTNGVLVHMVPHAHRPRNFRENGSDGHVDRRHHADRRPPDRRLFARQDLRHLHCHCFHGGADARRRHSYFRRDQAGGRRWPLSPWDSQ